MLTWLGPLLFNAWYNWGFSANLFNCVLHGEDNGFPCARDDPECAQVTPNANLNFTSMNETEVWKYGNKLLAVFEQAYRGPEFVLTIPQTYPGTDHSLFLQVGRAERRARRASPRARSRVFHARAQCGARRIDTAARTGSTTRRSATCSRATTSSREST